MAGISVNKVGYGLAACGAFAALCGALTVGFMAGQVGIAQLHRLSGLTASVNSVAQNWILKNFCVKAAIATGGAAGFAVGTAALTTAIACCRKDAEGNNLFPLRGFFSNDGNS